MAENVPSGTCSNDQCPFKTTGKCLEGFSGSEIPIKCPNFGQIGAVPTKESHNAELKDHSERDSNRSYVDLPSGNALRLEDAYQITSKRPAQIVLCAGPIDSGKTTFLCSIYEAFRRGPFSDLLFAGSETISGFEERCHNSRLASGRDTAHTDRTQTEAEDNLLHLQLCEKDDIRKSHDFLFVDVSGELFDAARNSSEEVLRIPFIEQARQFVLFFDGDALSNLKLRHITKQRGLELLRSCTEQKMLNLRIHLQIVVTKEDEINTSDDKENTTEFIDKLFSEIQTKYADHLSSIAYFKVAARPSADPDIEDAHGVSDILKSWIKPVHVRSQTRRVEGTDIGLVRGIDLFAKSTVQEPNP